MKKHIPVMTREVIQYLAPQKNKDYIDATVGLGGHAKEILRLIRPDGKLLCLDQNNDSLEEAKKNLKLYSNHCIFINNNFKNLANIVKENKLGNIHGILYDLGLASWQIENSGLGISFSKDEPLNMNLTNRNSLIANRKNLTAEEIVNKFPVKKIADILYQYGDVRNSWGVAKRIDIARRIKPIKTTFDLKNVLNSNNPKTLAPIFQALRIAVNDEFNNLTVSLNQAINIVEVSGRIVVLSYHSGEDRIVKNIFRANKDKLKILTKKPIVSSRIEIKNNPRARSGKLRAVEKIR